MTKANKSIEISVDGGVTWIKAPEGARVLVKNAIESDIGFDDILVNVTHEGVIIDQYSGTEEVLPIAHSLYEDMVS